MSTIRFRVLANLYKDSVTLMQVAARLRTIEGVEQASCLMATPANLAQLLDADLSVDTRASPADLLVVVRGAPGACDAALALAEDTLLSQAPGPADRGDDDAPPPSSIAMARQGRPDADLALISVPGDYAGAEAMKALQLGLHVMLFSDNVPLAEEVEIKSFARERDLLVMGPDCGTAIVNGVPLGFANVVRRGDIGLVAASGTGLQEVTCRIHNRGGGISQALGTGGRDLKAEVGGITMLRGLAALAADPDTRVIALVSKPPAPQIAQRIRDAAAATGKPVVVHFLGAAPQDWPPGLHGASSLCHAADLALALARGEAILPVGCTPAATDQARVAALGASMRASQQFVRALFTGGTFCYEAQLAFTACALPCRSNAPAAGTRAFDGRFAGHVLLDLGDDEYTRGRPHPMIDPMLRDAMVREQGADAQVAALLFDVVLGYGAHPDPAAGLSSALADARERARSDGRTLALIGHVCGTDGDPQGKADQVRRLEQAGALVVGSNIEAAMLAAQLAARRP